MAECYMVVLLDCWNDKAATQPYNNTAIKPYNHLTIKTMDVIKFLATTLTILGILLLLFACIIFLKEGGKVMGFFIDNKWDSLAPFLLGIIFLVSGISLIKRIDRKY